MSGGLRRGGTEAPPPDEAEKGELEQPIPHGEAGVEGALEHLAQTCRARCQAGFRHFFATFLKAPGCVGRSLCVLDCGRATRLLRATCVLCSASCETKGAHHSAHLDAARLYDGEGVGEGRDRPDALDLPQALGLPGATPSQGVRPASLAADKLCLEDPEDILGLSGTADRKAHQKGGRGPCRGQVAASWLVTGVWGR